MLKYGSDKRDYCITSLKDDHLRFVGDYQPCYPWADLHMGERCLWTSLSKKKKKQSAILHGNRLAYVGISKLGPKNFKCTLIYLVHILTFLISLNIKSTIIKLESDIKVK